MREALKHVKRVVVKVGSSILARQPDQLDRRWLEGFVRQIVELRRRRCEVVVVSSGAIASGMGLVGLKRRPGDLARLQACAAIGQGQLIRMYDELFSHVGVRVGQVLLTWDDFTDRKRFVSAKRTFRELFALGVVPVVNENDTVSTEEIRFGDNDRLAASVANLVDAEVVVILSDVEGLKLDHRAGAGSQILATVTEITPEIERLARGTLRPTATGGMAAKVEAAKVATGSGIPLVIANGRVDRALLQVLEGEPIGTLFVPRLGRTSSRKRWIRFSSKPKGMILVDEGAREALMKRGTSLLARGILGVEGEFDTGDIVSVADPHRRIFARGQVQFPSEELAKIRGLKSSELASVLGRPVLQQEVIHRNQLVIQGA